MAAKTDAPAQVVDPQLIGNSFVEQYYKVLHEFPDHVHKFYQDSSILGRPGSNGLMTSVTTMNAINEQIMSMEYEQLQTEILTVDAQGSYCSGVIVLVIGFLTGKDNVKRKFAQSFFLAPQEKGFFVLNDVFRYVDDHQVVVVAANGTDQTAPTIPLPTENNSGPTRVSPNDQSILTDHDTAATSSPNEDHTNINNVNKLEAIFDQSIMLTGKTNNNSTESSVPKKLESHHQVAALPQPDSLPLKQIDAQPVTSIEIDSPRLQDASCSSRKSFASIVNALKDNSTPFRAPPFKPVERSRVAPTAPTPTNDHNASRRNGNKRSAAAAKSKSFSIFVANLPIDITVEQLKEMFVKFGSIIPNGVQIRTNKLRPNCFGFVEFESVTSMLNAIQASPLLIANRKIFVEEKKVGSDSSLKPTPIGYASNNYKVTSNNPVGYLSSNNKVTANGRNPLVTTVHNAAGESTRVPQKEGIERLPIKLKYEM